MALLAMLARDETTKGIAVPDRKRIARETGRFRTPRGLPVRAISTGGPTRMASRGVDFERLMLDEAGIETLARTRNSELQHADARRAPAVRSLPGAAQASPRQGEGSRKRRTAEDPVPDAAGLVFRTRLKRAIPDDLAGYVAGIGDPRTQRLPTG